MSDAAIVNFDKQKALRIFKAMDIDCEIVDDDLQILVDNHPTIRAYLAGELTLSEALFIEAYLSNGFNAAKAAKTAKYRAFSSGGFSSVGTAILKRPKVRQLLARRIAEQALNADEVLARMRDVAQGSMEDFVDIREIPIYTASEEGEVEVGVREAVIVDPVKALKEGKFHLLKKYRVDDKGVIHMELRDQDHALDQLARAAGAFEKDHAQQLPAHVVALLKLEQAEFVGRDDVYDEMEDWEESDGLLGEGPREADEAEPEATDAG